MAAPPCTMRYIHTHAHMYVRRHNIHCTSVSYASHLCINYLSTYVHLYVCMCAVGGTVSWTWRCLPVIPPSGTHDGESGPGWQMTHTHTHARTHACTRAHTQECIDIFLLQVYYHSHNELTGYCICCMYVCEFFNSKSRSHMCEECVCLITNSFLK